MAFNDDVQLCVVKGCRGEVLGRAEVWFGLAVGSVRDGRLF